MTIASAFRIRACFLLVCFGTLLPCNAGVSSDPPLWIWTTLHQAGEAPAGACHFRRTFDVSGASQAVLEIAADDNFQVFVNGKEVGRGSGWKYLKKYDVSEFLMAGRNAIAVKVVNRHVGSAGLAARLSIESSDGSTQQISTDKTWKTSVAPVKFWQRTRYADSRWRASTEYGAFGATQPWINQPLPTVERIAAIHSPTRPRRIDVTDLPAVDIALAAATEPEARPKHRTQILRPIRDALPSFEKPKKGGLLAPLFKGDSKSPKGKPTPREIVNDHVAHGSGHPQKAKQKKQQPSPRAIVDPHRVSDTGNAQVQRPGSQTKAVAPAAKVDRVSAVKRQFSPAKGFRVESVLDGTDTGSLISASFNEFGQLLAGQENGPLLLIEDSDGDTKLDSVRTYCDKVTNCQGILALSGMVFVLADGPSGSALYRLNDADRDGNLEEVRPLVQFEMESGEHGPHGLVLGPEGNLYVTVGNHATIKGNFDPLSPRRELYEGDLIGKYEDPGGHAQGIKVPGGFILRTDVQGAKVELFASGLRNAYDLAFNASGQLFTQDSDMESDMGSTWYRPTRLYHVLPGSEFGWRSGWSKWPSYYQDVVPPVLETGRGSPTGIVFYDHQTYPSEYHGVAFVGDWSQGRILTVRFQEQGATYSAETETFLEGKPLNVTDLDVGPDGMLYFVTGGRGTQGGLFRVELVDKPQLAPERSGIHRAVTSPQLNSSWGRQRVAAIQRDLGSAWADEIANAAKDPTLSTSRRLQALQTMQWVGPLPSSELLIELSRDVDYSIRRMAAYLMTKPTEDAIPLRLVELLDDRVSEVRRQAAESLVRANRAVPYEYVEPLLKSKHRAEVWAGRRLLALDNPSEWQQNALETTEIRAFIPAATTLMTAWPTKDRGLKVLDRTQQWMKQYVSDQDFVELLRLIELTLINSDIVREDAESFVAGLAEEYPAGDDIMNRELLRLLVRLQVTSIKDRYLAELRRELPESERVHLISHLVALDIDWTSDEKIEIADHLQSRGSLGSGVPKYLQNIASDFAKRFTADENRVALSNGVESPAAAMAAVLRLPEDLSVAQIKQLIQLDRSVTAADEASERLKVAVLAILARDGQERSMAYLRHVFDHEPKRRREVAIGLAEHPVGENWLYLVKSLGELDPPIAKEVIVKLQTVDRSPESAEAYRQVISAGLRLGNSGGNDAVKLLEHWRGFATTSETPEWNKALVAWQNWFVNTYPDEPVPASNTTQLSANWDYDTLLQHVNDATLEQASLKSGQNLFVEAQCAKCHRHGAMGEAMGPDLSTIGSRFGTKEIIDSMVYPSRTISGQYRAKTIITDDGSTHTGIVGAGGEDELVILDATGRKIRVAKESVEQTVPSKLSAMPEGLLSSMTLEEVADLVAFLKHTPTVEVTKRPQP